MRNKSSNIRDYFTFDLKENKSICQLPLEEPEDGIDENTEDENFVPKKCEAALNVSLTMRYHGGTEYE